ncbi:MAG: hypothetical protein ABSF38_13535 [Verrucomicrobiota bacterium]
MRRFGLIMGLWLGLLAAGANAGTYTLTDGSRVSGAPMTYQEAGVVFKQGSETYSALVPWGRFTDEALKQLMTDAATPREKAIVEPMVADLPAENPQSPEITISPVETPPRPTGHLGLLAIFTSLEGWVILLVLYGANLLAAYEVAVFRNQPFQRVCAYAAIPFFGIAIPIYFLAMPTVPPPEADLSPASQPEPLSPTFATAPVFSRTPEAQSPPSPASSENIPPAAAAASEPPPGELPPPIIYQRGDFSFNRRFFETKLAAYFRVVLGDAEKDMVLQIKSSRGDFIGKRISRITPTDLYLQVFKEGATADEMIPFVEIMEVQIRHKDLA